MAVKSRKSSTNGNVQEKTNKSNKKAQNNKSTNNVTTSKYRTYIGILIVIFGGIYLALFGNYIYKRKTGQKGSALKHENPFHFPNINQGNKLNMNKFRRVIGVDDNGKFVFAEEDPENMNEVYVDVNGNVQVPPSKEEIDEMNQRQKERENPESAKTTEGKKGQNGEKLNARQKRSVSLESGNSPDENGEMSSYLRNLLTRGPSASFTDILRNKIVILNPYGDDVNQPTSFTSTHRRYRRSINQHMYASGISMYYFLFLLFLLMIVKIFKI